jgi:Domain of unknown function (DU1801)
MSTNKTKPSEASVDSYFATITDESRRKDCEALAKLLSEASKQPPKMWGPSIVGFGIRRYRYASGREGETCLVGFSSRKGDITIYGLGETLRCKDVAERLGKYKTGKGCLYVRRLSDIDTKQLTRLARAAVTARAE